MRTIWKFEIGRGTLRSGALIEFLFCKRFFRLPFRLASPKSWRFEIFHFERCGLPRRQTFGNVGPKNGPNQTWMSFLGFLGFLGCLSTSASLFSIHMVWLDFWFHRNHFLKSGEWRGEIKRRSLKKEHWNSMNFLRPEKDWNTFKPVDRVKIPFGPKGF